MVGYAYQRGLIPVSEAAILKAIELNGAAVESNTHGVPLGPPRRRRSRQGGRGGDARQGPAGFAAPVASRSTKTIERRVKFLTDYQDAAYAQRYAALVAKVARPRRARCPASPSSPKPWRATTSSSSRSRTSTKSRACTPRRISRSASPRSSRATTSSPSTSHRRSSTSPTRVTGVPKKSVYGPWMMKAFRVLAKMRKYRGTALDFFGRTAERRMERALIAEYEALVDGDPGQAHAAEPRDGGGARVGPRAHPRVRPREGSAPQDGEDARGGAARRVPFADGCAEAGGGEGGGLTTSPHPSSAPARRTSGRRT